MKKIKIGIIIITAVFFTSTLKAQSIDDGRKLMYYEKYISARNVFQQLVNANPGNTDAVYWLGQTMLIPEDTRDIATAKSLYQKALLQNSNSPLLIVGMGHVALLEGNLSDARNRFETAISLTQGKSIPVLNAIGVANIRSKAGDAQYAIDKLKQATTIRGFKDPEVYVNIGDAYRKFADGSNAVTAYQSAITMDPNYARAYFRTGQVYQTQGPDQRDIFLKYYNDAIARDPNYSPVDYILYDYYYRFDVVKSAQYLDKYLTTKGADEPNGCYYAATMKFAQGLFQETLSKTNECIATAKVAGKEPYPNLYGLLGYAYKRMNDSMNAKAAFDNYFAKQKPDKILPGDDTSYAFLLLKFPGNEALASSFINKAVDLDTTEAGKLGLMGGMASYYEDHGMYKEAAEWYKKVLGIKKVPRKTDIFNMSYNYYKSGDYKSAIDGWDVYTSKFPDDVFGYDMKGRSQRAIDTTLQQGLANPSYQKVIELGEAQWATDSAKVKAQLIRAYKYFIEYSYNVKKDKELAIMYCDKVLAKDPTDVEVQNYRKAFSAAPPPSRTPARTPIKAPVKTPATKPANNHTSGTTPLKSTGTKTSSSKKK